MSKIRTQPDKVKEFLTILTDHPQSTEEELKEKYNESSMKKKNEIRYSLLGIAIGANSKEDKIPEALDLYELIANYRYQFAKTAFMKKIQDIAIGNGANKEVIYTNMLSNLKPKDLFKVIQNKHFIEKIDLSNYPTLEKIINDDKIMSDYKEETQLIIRKNQNIIREAIFNHITISQNPKSSPVIPERSGGSRRTTIGRKGRKNT